MQKSCRCTFMYGEMTDKETIARIDECLENQLQDQFEILLYKKNSKWSPVRRSLPVSGSLVDVLPGDVHPGDEAGRRLAGEHRSGWSTPARSAINLAAAEHATHPRRLAAGSGLAPRILHIIFILLNVYLTVSWIFPPFRGTFCLFDSTACRPLSPFPALSEPAINHV